MEIGGWRRRWVSKEGSYRGRGGEIKWRGNGRVVEVGSEQHSGCFGGDGLKTGLDLSLDFYLDGGNYKIPIR
jgi:hypothetical protein